MSKSESALLIADTWLVLHWILLALNAEGVPFTHSGRHGATTWHIPIKSVYTALYTELNGQILCTNTWRGWFSRENWLSPHLKCLPLHTHDLVRRQATTTKQLLVGQKVLVPLSWTNLCSEYHSSWLNTHAPHHITCTHTYYMQTYIRTHAHTHAHMCFIASRIKLDCDYPSKGNTLYVSSNVVKQ